MATSSIAPLPALTLPPVQAAPEPAPRAPAAHPFAELLRQNRLAATAVTTPAPAPPPPDETAASEGIAEADASDAPEAPSARPAASTPARPRPKAGTATPAISDTATREAQLADRHDDKAEGPARSDPTGATATPADVLAHAMAHLQAARADGGSGTASDDDAEGSAGAVRGGADATRAATADARNARMAAERDDARTRFETALATAADATAAMTTEASVAPLAALAVDAAPGLRTEAPGSVAAAQGAAALAAPAAESPGTPAAPVDVALATPVDSPDFAQALGVQVSVLAKDGVQQAELHLNPAETGPISVHIAIDGTQARVEFAADAAATRHAIEAGLPELAGALRDAGLTLHGGGVSAHAGGRDRNGDDTGGSRARGGVNGVTAGATSASSAARPLLMRAGGVDVYA
jgi:flagellar hook-length control protein FliK